MADVKEPDPKEPVKRLNYFTGQFLVKEDFLAEQQYHMGLRRRGNRVLYFGPGVLENSGFLVSQVGTHQVKIAPGIAIDVEGRELILVAEQTVDVPQAGGTDRVVTIEYATQPTDEQTAGDTDHGDFTRVLEMPAIEVVPKDTQTASMIVIASLTVNTNGEVTAVNTGDCQRANARFAGGLTIGQGSNGTLTTRHINGKDYPNDNADDLYLNWDNGKGVHVGGGGGKVASLTVSGPVEVQAPDNGIYSVQLSRTDEDGRLHKWALWHMNQQYRKNALEIWEYKADSTGKVCDGNPNDGAMCTPRLVIAEGGNVGIGTVTPRAKLEVAGGAIMPADGESDNAGILFPLDPGGGGGDKAWIRYYSRNPNDIDPSKREQMSLVIGVANDANDHIGLMASGGVGVGTVSPVGKFDVAGDIALNGKHALRGNDPWLRLNQDSAFPSGVHTPGNFAAGALNVGGAGGWGNPGPGNVWVVGSVGIGTATPQARLDVNGAIFSNEGIIARSFNNEADVKRLFSGNIGDPVRVIFASFPGPNFGIYFSNGVGQLLRINITTQVL